MAFLFASSPFVLALLSFLTFAAAIPAFTGGSFSNGTCSIVATDIIVSQPKAIPTTILDYASASSSFSSRYAFLSTDSCTSSYCWSSQLERYSSYLYDVPFPGGQTGPGFYAAIDAGQMCRRCEVFPIASGSVEVIYWPTPAPTGAVTSFVRDGHTFVSPTAYVGFSRLAGNGVTLDGWTTIAVDPGAFSSMWAANGFADSWEYAQAFDFADFNGCANATLHEYRTTSTHRGQMMTRDRCFPVVSVPSEVLALRPEWASCTGGSLGHAYDPPTALISFGGLAAPSAGAQRPAADGPADVPANPTSSPEALQAEDPGAEQGESPGRPTPAPTPRPSQVFHPDPVAGNSEDSDASDGDEGDHASPNSPTHNNQPANDQSRPSQPGGSEQSDSQNPSDPNADPESDPSLPSNSNNPSDNPLGQNSNNNNNNNDNNNDEDNNIRPAQTLAIIPLPSGAGLAIGSTTLPLPPSDGSAGALLTTMGATISADGSGGIVVVDASGETQTIPPAAISAAAASAAAAADDSQSPSAFTITLGSSSSSSSDEDQDDDNASNNVLAIGSQTLTALPDPSSGSAVLLAGASTTLTLEAGGGQVGTVDGATVSLGPDGEVEVVDRTGTRTERVGAATGTETGGTGIGDLVMTGLGGATRTGAGAAESSAPVEGGAFAARAGMVGMLGLAVLCGFVAS